MQAIHPQDCEACRFAVASVTCAPIGRSMIGCVMHNQARLRRGQGCRDHAPAETAALAIDQIDARARRVRAVLEAGR